MLQDAVHDNLTGLPNRVRCCSTGSKACWRWRRRIRAMRPTVLAIDVDRFKQINEDDRLGRGQFSF